MISQVPGTRPSKKKSQPKIIIQRYNNIFYYYKRLRQVSRNKSEPWGKIPILKWVWLSPGLILCLWVLRLRICCRQVSGHDCAFCNIFFVKGVLKIVNFFSWSILSNGLGVGNIDWIGLY